MQFAMCFVVFVALIGRTSLAKMMIEATKSDGFAELEESAIKMLTTCYANRSKTIVLVGDFPGTFVEKLSSHRKFSLITLDILRRADDHFEHWKVHDNMENWNIRYRKRTHKVDLVVTAASFYERVKRSLHTYFYSPYTNPAASVLIIGYSPVHIYGCYEVFRVFGFLFDGHLANLINTKFLCNHSDKGIMIAGINPFTNNAPEPWHFIGSARTKSQRNYDLHYFAREYREHEEMCKNLDFDKTQDMGGSPIKMARQCFRREGIYVCSEEASKLVTLPRRLVLEEFRRFNYIYEFVTYVNATKQHSWIRDLYLSDLITMRPLFVRGVHGYHSYAFPHGRECKFLLTQFRGNKTQLGKIVSVIDRYSWVGMLLAYLVTLMFFKYFLRQPLIPGILDLIRLTANTGLTREPPDVAPRIYLGCLFFFVVTMQGIFTGNLASLLTHDVPVRHVNTVQDLVDMGYIVSADSYNFIYFEDPYFRDHLIETEKLNDRIRCVYHNFMCAGLCWSANTREKASLLHFHVSDCIATEYITNIIPWKWMMEERLTEYVGIMVAAGITVDLSAMVNEERYADIDALGNPDDPQIMIFAHIRFAFVFFSIGLAISFVAFLVEIIIDQYRRRSTTTRVIIL